MDAEAASSSSSSSSSAAAAADVAPSQTLYLNNLNEKVKKAALKKGLYAALSSYGRIVDIVVCKTERLKGQAWVAFSDTASATQALRAMQGFTFYDKPMVRSAALSFSLLC